MARERVRFQHIRDLRHDANLSQDDMAKILNCTQAAYSYYETGRRDIPTETLIQLAKYHQCSTDYLLDLTNTKKPYPDWKAQHEDFS